jgi:hypothetical protein
VDSILECEFNGIQKNTLTNFKNKIFDIDNELSGNYSQNLVNKIMKHAYVHRIMSIHNVHAYNEKAFKDHVNKFVIDPDSVLSVNYIPKMIN